MQRRTRRSAAGQSIIEFAIVAPILVLILLGIVAFGQMFSYQLILSNAAREGARVGVLCKTDAEIDAAVRDRANPLPHHDDPSSLEVYINPDESSADRVNGNPLVVQVRYVAYITVPIAGVFINPKYMMARTVMRIEQCTEPLPGGNDNGGSSGGSTSSSSGGDD
ncbi:MAG: pilus assembly protein [Armatimonadetes bacterium]|nr:pilus assembly protein [Armatimonadota bacterium]PIU64396.1 MAG: pilus assembly protein TadG [Armatimonadetes bacterium CG07_land_8_20_14_0_80_59_28]PIX45496.1 MAG: pilus assembly protein TadG [Armatimonadetes bacterium CG_4_8_14_3_um_filter_58_9]PJB76218.1 MAG: pilus assembly protein TadG [Armatimonadetes bacterium CG_4_9_14_3_um_filter_58_7]